MNLLMQTLGIFGAFFVLFGFTMMKIGKWKNEDLYYNLSNLIGSVFLVLNALYFKNIAFFILNTVWTYLSLIDVLKIKNIIKIKNN